MEKLRLQEVLVVEGKYDAVKLADIVDALIITTDGFSIYNDTETKELIKSLGRKRGIIILTDSDAAGFQIRNYIQNFAEGIPVKNAYIPAIAGKEPRKRHAGKEGLLGVEGVSAEVIRTALQSVCSGCEPPRESENSVTYADLYAWGLSGTPNSAVLRRSLLRSIGLPYRLSKKALCMVINSLYSYEEFDTIVQREKQKAE